MSTEYLLATAIGFANLGVVVVLAVHLQRLGLRPPLPLTLLGLVFGIRALRRLVFPNAAEGPDAVLIALDATLLVVLVLIVFTARRFVTSFVAERDEALRSRIDYDQALVYHESAVAERMQLKFDDLDSALIEIESANTDADRQRAINSARRSVNQMRDTAAGTNSV